MASTSPMIAGVGLAERPRKSRLPARLDWLQSATGLVLALFMWGHMFFVSSILVSEDFMWRVTKMFEGYLIKDLLKKVITSQEEERKRIAREFHDGILQDLAAMLIRVDVLKSYPESITPEKIEDIRSIIEKNIHEVYTIIKNLRPSILDDLGFEAAVRLLLNTHLESKGIACFVTISHAINTIEFEPLAEIELFRIIQEAITNIAKHAKAENVFVLLDLRDDLLDIEIEDDGHGFDPASVGLETDSGRGLGLLGMEERASFLTGC